MSAQNYNVEYIAIHSNSIKVLKEKATKENNPENTKKTQNTHMHTHTKIVYK